MSYFTSKKQSLVISTTALIVVLIFWNILSRRFHPFILPSPFETYLAIIDLWRSGELQRNILITFRRTVISYFFAVVSALIFALLLKKNGFMRDFFRPLITVIQITPPIVLLAFALIWFGVADDLTPMFLIFLVSFPIIFINVFAGIDGIDMNLLEMAKVYCCSRKKIFFNIYLPSLLPHLFSAISIGLAFAWKSTIFAEFIASSSGVGFALSMANSNLQTEKLFAWAIILIIFMMFFEYGLLNPIRVYLTRWSGNE
ncbi:ABC transporter permease [Natronospora cellulosivora (SeqCode)]